MAMLTQLKNNTYLEILWKAQNILEMREGIDLCSSKYKGQL